MYSTTGSQLSQDSHVLLVLKDSVMKAKCTTTVNQPTNWRLGTIHTRGRDRCSGLTNPPPLGLESWDFMTSLICTTLRGYTSIASMDSPLVLALQNITFMTDVGDQHIQVVTHYVPVETRHAPRRACHLVCVLPSCQHTDEQLYILWRDHTCTLHSGTSTEFFAMLLYRGWVRSWIH